MRLGSRTSASRSMPRVMHATSIASSTTVDPNARHCQVLSSVVANVRYMSRWRVSTGRSVGSSGPPPSCWTMSSAADHPDEGLEVREVAGPPAPFDVGDERRPTDRADDQVAIAEDEVSLRVAGVQLEARRRLGDQLLDLRRLQADPTGGAAPRVVVRLDARRWRRRCSKWSSARAPRTSTPTSRRIRRPARWIGLDVVRAQDLHRRERVDDPSPGEPRDAPARPPLPPRPSANCGRRSVRRLEELGLIGHPRHDRTGRHAGFRAWPTTSSILRRRRCRRP